MLTERQQKILNNLIREYIDNPEPVSSDSLKKKLNLNVSPATIRNELQELTELGYVVQPHTSAGRVPTEKAYRYFVSITFSGDVEQFPKFILKEIETTKQKIDRELELARNLTRELEQISAMLEFKRIEEDMMLDILKIIGSSQSTYDKNMDLISRLLEEFKQF